MAKTGLSRPIGIPLFAIVGLSVVLAGCGHSDAVSTEDPHSESAAEEAVVVLTVVPAEQRSMGQTLTVLGRCAALPQKQALITPTVEGQVKAILVEQGSAVTAGQPILQLDTTLALADRVEKEAARDSLDASLRMVVSLPRAEERATSQLAVEQATVAIEVARALVERLRPLVARKELPESQLFEAEQALRQAELQKRTAQAQSELLMLRPRDEVIAEAQSKIKVAEAAVKSAEARLDLHTIRAPIDGVLDSLTCRRGQTIAVGGSVGEIFDNREVMAIAWLPVARGQMTRVGQTAHVHTDTRFRADGNSAANSPTHTGKVTFVGKVVDPQTGNIPVQVCIDNHDGDLVLGQMLYLDIEVESPADKLCVPQEAIHDEGEGPAITVVRDGKAQVLHPQLGTGDAGWIPITDTDLKAGEAVAVTGAYNLPDGTPVKTQTANKVARDAE